MPSSVTPKPIIVLAKDLGQRRYDQVVEGGSMRGRHLLLFLLEVAEDGVVRRDTLMATIRQAGHDWTEEQLDSYLKELSLAHCFSEHS
jgi:hypothetical protein